MIHPIETSDIARKFPFAEKLPPSLVERLARWLPPLKTSEIKGISSIYAETEGWFVACPLTTRQMLELPEEYVLQKIIQTGKLAERLGAEIVGLGAMTSVVGDAGITVAKNLNIAVTTGNSYTVATAIQGAKKAAELMNHDLASSTVAIIGATGSIGAICAQIMARDCPNLILVARNQERLQHIASLINDKYGVLPRISANIKEVLPQADIVVTVTSAVDTVIEPEDLKPGAVVCDVARPRDVSKKVAEARDDVLIIEGGVVEVPGDPDFNFNFGYEPKTALACMAETITLALEGRIENFTLGRELTLEQVEEIEKMAEKHGFKLAGFRSFERPVTPETIERVRLNALKNAGKASAFHGASVLDNFLSR